MASAGAGPRSFMRSVASGSPAYVAGANGQAISLNGSNQFVTLPPGMMNVNEITIAARVNWGGGAAWQRIFDFGTSATGEDVSDGNGGYLFLSPEGPSAIRFSVRDPNTGTEPAPVTAVDPQPTDQEIYLAVTYDYADNIARG